MTSVNLGYFGIQSDSDARGGKPSMSRLSGVSSTDFLKMFEERANAGFWTSEFATDRFTISDGLKRLLAIHDTEDATYANLVKMMHPDDRASHDNIRALVRLGQPVDREYRIIRADGTLRWIRNIADVVADRNGVPVRAVGLCLDVTHQHEASRSVTEGWRSYKTLVSAIAPIQWRSLPNGRVISRDGWEGDVDHWSDGTTKFLEQIHPEDRERVKADWDESLASGKVLNSAFRLLGLDGQFRQFLSRAAPLLDDNGAIREWLGVLIPVGLENLRQPDRAPAAEPEQDIQKEILLEASQVRAARAYLQWTKEDLASNAGISVSTVKRMESEIGRAVRARHFQAVRDAFQAAGVGFVNGPGSQTAITLQKTGLR